MFTAIKRLTRTVLCFAMVLVSVVSTQACDKEPEGRKMTNGPVYDAVNFPRELWDAPAYERDEQRDRNDEVKAIWYTTYCNGVETKAFAYLGIPKEATEKDPAPAVLLLHGGAGTAYYEWVQMWVDRGFVALAPDLEGHVPTQDGRMTSEPSVLYTKSEYISLQNQNYADASLPVEQTWMYYAAVTAFLGNSLLHSIPQADVQRIGVCGVSWGGVLTSIITGYDDRFAFSVPIYCSLNIAGNGGFLAEFYKEHPGALVWDDDRGLTKVTTPILFYTANTDSVNACSVLSVSKTYERCQNARLLIMDGFLHSQYYAANAIEPYLFAESIVGRGRAFAKAVRQPSAADATFVYDGDAAQEARIWYTADDVAVMAASWSSQRLEANGRQISCVLPSDARYFYIAVDDGGGGITSAVADAAG